MQKLYSLLLAALFICIPLFLLSQDSTIKGNVSDAESGEPLIFLTIKINDTGTTTDYDGNYSMNLPPGSYELQFNYVGYNTEVKRIELGIGEVATVDVQLNEKKELLNEIVVTESKFAKPAAEVTVSIEVIKPSLIENSNNTSIDETLEKVPGVNIIDGQANIRGGSGYSYGAGSRVLLLVDDMPMLQADAGFPNWSFAPIENTSQIEVIKGAASALYGSSAMNGIINIRTAYPTTEPFTQVKTFGTVYGSPNSNSEGGLGPDGEEMTKSWWDAPPHQMGISFAHREKIGRIDLVTGGYFLRDVSYRQREFDNRGRVNLNLRYRVPNKEDSWFHKRYLSFGANTNIQTGKSASFFVWDYRNGGNEDDLGFGLYQPWNSGGTEVITENNLTYRFNIDPFIRFSDEKGNNWRLSTRYYKTGNENDSNQSNYSDIFYEELQYQRRFTDAAFSLTTGLVGQQNKVEAELYGDQVFTGSNYAAYLQLEKKFFDALTVSTGGRYERNELVAPDTTKVESRPVVRFGLNYQLAEFSFLRASWGQGYRYPTIAERYISTEVGLFGIFENPNLQSETGWTAELGFRQGLKISDWLGYADGSVFINEYQDMMEFGLQPNPDFPLGAGFQSNNVGNTRIVGTEVSLAGRGKIGAFPTEILMGYTYIIPKFQEWDTILPPDNVPVTQAQMNFTGSVTDYNVLKYRFRHSLKFDIQSSLNKIPLHFGAAVIYNSRMENIDKAFNSVLPGVAYYRENIEAEHGNATIDLRTAYNISDNFKFGFLIKNVLNREYSIRPAIIEAPRNYTLNMTYTL